MGTILGFTEMLNVGIYGPLSKEQQQATQEVIAGRHYLTDRVSDLLDQAQLWQEE